MDGHPDRPTPRRDGDVVDGLLFARACPQTIDGDHVLKWVGDVNEVLRISGKGNLQFSGPTRYRNRTTSASRHGQHRGTTHTIHGGDDTQGARIAAARSTSAATGRHRGA